MELRNSDQDVKRISTSQTTLIGWCYLAPTRCIRQLHLMRSVSSRSFTFLLDLLGSILRFIISITWLNTMKVSLSGEEGLVAIVIVQVTSKRWRNYFLCCGKELICLRGGWASWYEYWCDGRRQGTYDIVSISVICFRVQLLRLLLLLSRQPASM